jgi:hypothetical protein
MSASDERTLSTYAPRTRSNHWVRASERPRL